MKNIEDSILTSNMKNLLYNELLFRSGLEENFNNCFNNNLNLLSEYFIDFINETFSKISEEFLSMFSKSRREELLIGTSGVGFPNYSKIIFGKEFSYPFGSINFIKEDWDIKAFGKEEDIQSISSYMRNIWIDKFEDITIPGKQTLSKLYINLIGSKENDWAVDEEFSKYLQKYPEKLEDLKHQYLVMLHAKLKVENYLKPFFTGYEFLGNLSTMKELEKLNKEWYSVLLSILSEGRDRKESIFENRTVLSILEELNNRAGK